MDSDEWIETQKHRLFTNSSVQGPHNCWICKLGGLNKPYSTLTVKFPWVPSKKTMNSHRFAYMIDKKIFELPKELEISHRCHNKRCVNPEHLSCEPDVVNKDRQICRGIFPTRCKTHAPYQDCLL